METFAELREEETKGEKKTGERERDLGRKKTVNNLVDIMTTALICLYMYLTFLIEIE